MSTIASLVIDLEVDFYHDQEYQDISNQLTKAIKKKVKKTKLASLVEQLKMFNSTQNYV